MVGLIELEKLENLKKKKLITTEEYLNLRKTIIDRYGNFNETKDQCTYCVLALFFGSLGVHNFYAKHIGIAITQLLLSLLLFLFGGPFVASVISTINIFTIDEDGKGNKMTPSPTAKIVCGIFNIIFNVISFVFLIMAYAMISL